MATTKVNARDWTFELNTGTEAVPAFTEIGGITSMTVSYDAEETDTTTFASQGVAEHEVMQRSRSYTVEGFFLEDPADGTRDAGQEAAESLGDQVGAASLKQLRITSPGGAVWTQQVSARPGDVGGANNDKTSWAMEFVRSGATMAA